MTACRRCLLENADPTARHDLEEFFNRLVPEKSDYFTHGSGDDEAATRVLNEHSHCPVSRARLVDLPLYIIGDFIQTLAVRANFKSIMMNVHKFSDRKYHVLK